MVYALVTESHNLRSRGLFFIWRKKTPDLRLRKTFREYPFQRQSAMMHNEYKRKIILDELQSRVSYVFFVSVVFIDQWYWCAWRHARGSPGPGAENKRRKTDISCAKKSCKGTKNSWSLHIIFYYINTNEIQVNVRSKTLYLHTWRDHRRYGYIINRAFFTGIYIINRILHARAWIWILSSRGQLDISLVRCAHSWDIELNIRR